MARDPGRFAALDRVWVRSISMRWQDDLSPDAALKVVFFERPLQRRVRVGVADPCLARAEALLMGVVYG